jgi:hypothetical protein
MKILIAIAISCLTTIGLSIGLSVPGLAQTESASDPNPSNPSEQNLSDPNSSELTQPETTLPITLSDPLEVGIDQLDEVFRLPQTQQTVETQTRTSISEPDLVGPPPGSQTPNQMTPERQLSLPIR